MAKSDLLALSPHLEVLIRKCYRRGPKFLQKFKKTNRPTTDFSPQDFDAVLESTNQILADQPTPIVVIHSSYEKLRGTGRSPRRLCEDLKSWATDNSLTLVFPAFVNWPDYQENEAELVYHKRKSRIWTGALPFVMCRDEQASLSDHPLNTVVAFGDLADKVVEGNLSGGSLCRAASIRLGNIVLTKMLLCWGWELI